VAWTTTDDPEEFLAAAGAYLHAAPAANSMTLTAVEAMRGSGRGGRGGAPALFGSWQAPGEAVTGTFMHTPPYPLHLSAMPPAAVAALAETLEALERRLPGVNGRSAAAEAFAAAWSARTGARACVVRRMRLHRLDALVDPDPPPPGAAAIAGPEHRELLVAWYEAFGAEIDEAAADVRPAVDDRISYGGATLWLVEGEPVAFAGTTRAVAGTLRIAPVYTPPEHRGHGYAAGATAAATRAALDRGVREVILYTDLANPTSNRLYARLGYRPVEDIVSLLFDG
jgi:RimJ/RimL family protein N-acetyltransferase